MTAGTATATYEPALARVRIDLAAFAAGTTSVQLARRRYDTGKLDLVRGCRALPTPSPASDSFTLFDYEAPPGVEVGYEYLELPVTTTQHVTDTGSATTTATYDVDGPWLKHPLRPYLNSRVTIRGYEPFSHQLRATVLAPIGYTVPLGRADVRAGRSFSIDVAADDQATRQRLDDFLAAGGVWLLQTKGSAQDVPSPVYVMATDATERVAGPKRSTRRVFSISLTEVQRPAIDLSAGGITWSSVTTQWATWSALTAARATWGDLLASVAVPSEVVISA